MYYKTLPLLLFLISLAPLTLSGEEDQDFNREHAIGVDGSMGIYHFKWSFYDSWHLRSGVFSSLTPDLFNSHFNLGIERNITSEEELPGFFIGLDAVSLNYWNSDNHYVGGGPVAGIRYNVTDRFNLSVEMGATGYMSDDDFRWTWHRKVAMFFGWRF